ncbi:MAG: translation initiation factor IF-2 subunit alpha [Crenarchaeota archaeon]|nr:translation initiation factor IF-2 subunit alpha [Thermoproteota archaeon]
MSSQKKGKEKDKEVPQLLVPVKIARKELPDVGELVVGTVTKIMEHGAYVILDEYGGLEAYVPINEIVQSWFHSIKDYLKPGQKAVFRVIRVDPRRKLIDVSLRKVREEEKKAKFLQWKRTVRAVKLLELVSQKTGIPLQELLVKVGYRFEDIYGDMLKGFEQLAKGNVDEVRRILKDIPDHVFKVIEEVAKEHIEIPEVTFSGIIRMINIRPDGVEHIKETLIKAKQLIEEKYNGTVKYKIYVVGPPRYRIDLTGRDPKLLDQILTEVSNFVIEEARRRGGEASFTRIQ